MFREVVGIDVVSRSNKRLKASFGPKNTSICNPFGKVRETFLKHWTFKDRPNWLVNVNDIALKDFNNARLLTKFYRVVSDCLFCYKIENSFFLEKYSHLFFFEIWERRYSSTRAKIEGHDLQDIKLMISCFRSKIYLPNRGLIRKQSQENHVMNQNSFSDLKQKRMKVKKMVHQHQGIVCFWLESRPIDSDFRLCLTQLNYQSCAFFIRLPSPPLNELWPL